MLHRLTVSFCAACLLLATAVAPAEDKPAPAAAKPIYDFTVKDIDGKEVSLSKYKGDVVMIVNVASECGYTDKTYSGLQALFDKYKDKGFKVVAFPANDFGGQEPGSDSQIKTFCTESKKVTFDLMSKVAAKGPDQAPIYKYLTTHPNKDVAGDLKWNFEKYVVGRDGQVIARFGTKTLPEDPKVIEAVEKALAAPRP